MKHEVKQASFLQRQQRQRERASTPSTMQATELLSRSLALTASARARARPGVSVFEKVGRTLSERKSEITAESVIEFQLISVYTHLASE